MSPPATTHHHSNLDIPKPDFYSSQTKSSESLEFFLGSTYKAGFSYSKTDAEIPCVSSRPRPRLVKMRKKLMRTPRDGKTDLGINGLCDAKGESADKSGNVFEVNRNMDQFGSGFVPGASLKDSSFAWGSGNGKSLYGSSTNSSTNELHSNFEFTFTGGNSTKSFVFGAREDCAGRKSNLNEKHTVGNLGQSQVHELKKSYNAQFVFGSSSNDSLSQGKLGEEKYSNKSGLGLNGGDFGTFKNANFVFGAPPDSINMDKSDSDKVCNSSFKFPLNRIDNGNINHVNFVSEVDSEKKSTVRNRDMHDVANNGKENTDNGFQSQRVCHNGVFVFGGLNGKGDFNSNGSTDEKDPAFSISHEMNKLKVGDSEVDDKRSGIFSGKFAPNTNNVFVFKGEQTNSDFIQGNHPSSGSSHNSFESDRSSSCFFQSAGKGVELNGGSCEVPSVDTGGLGELDSSNMKFDISNNILFPGINKLDNMNLRSLRGQKSKKKNGKLCQRTVFQHLSQQNDACEEDKFQQNDESPGHGSPMDVSPYLDARARNDTRAEGFQTSENHSSASLTAQDGLSALKSQYKKKYKMKIGSNATIQKKDPVKENAKQESLGTAIHKACEDLRIRGNEAYHAGQLSKAEEFYSMGINSAPHISAMGYSMKPLLLCYSNRAATRMSLGRMREAIGDCIKASELDPEFLKAMLRAGNCYLVLGEVEDAIECYSKCFSNGTSICLDRRVTIEATDGLHKAKKVAEQMHQSANLLQKGTEDAANSAMEIIEEALLISRFSEELLQMKGELLFTLRMYDKVIQLCERTLDVAEKNLSSDNLDSKSSHVKLWRVHLQAKSYYRLGKFDSALDLIDKQEKMAFTTKSGDKYWDTIIALAANIRELLSLKKSGNEAFSSGKYTEAIEYYTSAISRSHESRGFMSICFCNRAAAYQSLGQIVDAISDCSIAIALDESYFKAISRRATLHEMIRDYKQAIYDLEKLVSLLESQSQTKNQARSSGGSVRDLRKARRRLSLAEEKAKKEISLDLYLILGIKASDTESEIKKAYRKAALRHHPDKAGQVLARNDVADDGTLRKEFGEKIHTDADRLFKVIGEAYAVLSDPSKRSKYDDEEEMRKLYKYSSRNSSSEHPSTSYTSPHERGSFGRYSTTRRYWSEARSYCDSRW